MKPDASAASRVGDASTSSFDVDLPLVDWQETAVEAWVHGDDAGAHRGTLEIFTGGGKTLVALACMKHAADVAPTLRVAVVVPTLALARQWVRVLTERTRLREQDIGELHGDRRDDLGDVRVLVGVLNSAAQHLPAMTRNTPDPVMLVVDESHRAGANKFSRVLESRAEFRLGLSATADREDLDEDGLPLSYADHVLGRK